MAGRLPTIRRPRLALLGCSHLGSAPAKSYCCNPLSGGRNRIDARELCGELQLPSQPFRAPALRLFRELRTSAMGCTFSESPQQGHQKCASHAPSAGCPTCWQGTFPYTPLPSLESSSHTLPACPMVAYTVIQSSIPSLVWRS